MSVGTAGDQNGSEALGGPALGIGGEIAATAAAPAVVLDVEIEGRRPVQIGLKGECLLAFPPAIHQPSEGQFAGRKLHVDGRVLESAICQPELNVEARRREPANSSYMAVC